ncbi:hypothetical protein PS6_009871 [Mucor atramentarius]
MTAPQHQILNGRKFHANDKVAYLLPEDNDEKDRLHKQHVVLRYTLQSNFQAPLQEKLEQGITVLDSGCGPAAWVFDMAKDFPNSQFHGIDITSTFPHDAKPSNCEFTVANLTEGIPYPDNYFDYVHQRLLILGLTDANWDFVLKELLRVLKPGANTDKLQPDLQDLNNMGPLLRQLQYTMSSMLQSKGMPPKISNELQERATKAGFVDAQVQITALKLNHGGQAGKMLWDDYQHGYTNLRPVMAMSNAEWQDEELYAIHIENCAKEAETMHTSVNWYTCIAQKPL